MFYKSRVSKVKKIFSYTVYLAIIITAFYCIKRYFFTENINSFDKTIIDKSDKYCLDPNLVKAIIWRESNFNPNIIGKKGEIGLMQIMENSAVKDWEHYYQKKISGKGLLFNPDLNIEIGCWYLSKCRRHWRKYSEPELLMLAEYNAGYSNVKKWMENCDFDSSNLIEKIQFKSTMIYIQKIMGQYKYYLNKENLKKISN